MGFEFYMPSRILFGAGALNKLHEQKLPGTKALIVTSAGTSVKKFGYLDRVTEELKAAGAESVLFDKILPNPVAEHVAEGAALAKANGCDFVVGLGGGSSIDSAKSIAVMCTNPGEYWDYIEGGTGKNLPLAAPPLPVIAITTTAGTGTEADPWTVITKDGEKIGFGCDGTYPYLSVVDPELMLTVPPALTAYQGFDALFHSTEGYLRTNASAMSDLFALKAIQLIGGSLADAVKDGSDLVARADVALANTLSGIVESVSGCTAEHSIEHAMSGLHPALTHGAGLIMISNAYYTLAAESGVCGERLVEMARALGARKAKKPMDFVKRLTELQRKCGVDGLKMSEAGISREELPQIAAHAVQTMGGLFGVDPFCRNEAMALAVLERAYR